MYEILMRNIRITLAGREWPCDLAIGLYPTTLRPAIFLMSAPVFDKETDEPELFYSERIATASTNAPEEYIAHLPKNHFTAKNYSENAGLWEQLSELRDENGELFFIHTHWRITLGFASADIYQLSPRAYLAYFRSLKCFYKES